MRLNVQWAFCPVQAERKGAQQRGVDQNKARPGRNRCEKAEQIDLKMASGKTKGLAVCYSQTQALSAA